LPQIQPFPVRIGFGFWGQFRRTVKAADARLLLTGTKGSGHEAAREVPAKSTGVVMSRIRAAKFQIGQVVRHRVFPFRGVVFDVDPVFNNTEEWWLSIPEEIRPRKDQPYYHLFAENAETEYVAYVSEQNLLADESAEPLRHPQIREFFAEQREGVFKARSRGLN
jgi:heat shock protein HspQ